MGLFDGMGKPHRVELPPWRPDQLIDVRHKDMHAARVICEDGQPRLINLETVGLVERHAHANGEHGADSHEHTKPVVGLKLITGEYLVVLDDGGWGL